MEIQINNLQEEVEIESGLKELVRKVVSMVVEVEEIEASEVSIALVDNQRIRELNNQYRQLDEPTDVLSFPLGGEMLGDIIISLERACSQAKDYNHSITREVGFLTVHGMYHLLGYDHKNQTDKAEMRSKEEQILGELNLVRN
ncbi:MAG: rRNA maturation RNase YbeY [Bacillota bacterium]